MQVSDYIAKFLYEMGVKHAFVVSGGASLHLIHSIDRVRGMSIVCCHHEQSAAMAADAYTRLTGNTGVAVASSGPGATNLITGICGCYYDSIPALYITGQVSTFRMAGNTHVRQIGFQETPIVDMVEKITKYAVQITVASQIRYELEKAIFLSRHGRPGPVLIDIPDNIQREEVDPDMLGQYKPVTIDSGSEGDKIEMDAKIVLSKLKEAQRPVIIAGWGIHLAHCEREFIKLIEKLNVPVALTWAANDLLDFSHPLRIGTFGTHGSRYANFAVQNADFILSMGSRLDTKATGSPPNSFARAAWKAVNDICSHELNKFGHYNLAIDLLIHCSTERFIRRLRTYSFDKDFSAWVARINKWKLTYAVETEQRDVGQLVDPVIFLSNLSGLIPANSQLWSDTGSVIAWLMQSFRPIANQRIWHDFNNTAMGWALPAAIASKIAKPDHQALCLVGDGSIMMNLQELQTAISYSLDLKIICFDNSGYSMIQQTQDQWMNSNYIASSQDGGLRIPDLTSVAEAFGYKVRQASTTGDALDQVEWLISEKSAAFLLLKINPGCRVSPQVKYGRPNEDPEPLLDREQFKREMIVPPLKL